MKAFLSLMAYLLVAAAALTAVAGTLNYFFGLGLGLSIGGSDIALPEHIGVVLFLSVVLLFLAGLFEVLSDLGRARDFVKERKKLTAGIMLGAVGLVFLVALSVTGGPLGLAVEAGDTAKVQAILADTDYEVQELDPHLYQALKRGLLEMAQALFDAGADANYREGEFNTPLLSSAVIYFPEQSVLWLLERGADPNVKDSFGRTSVHLLLLYRSGNLIEESSEDRLRLLKALKDSGAQLDMAADDGRNAVSIAQDSKQQWALEFLESQGISIPEPK